jgi:hypothetical protein
MNGCVANKQDLIAGKIPHKNGVVTLAPFLLHERGTHSDCAKKRLWHFQKSQNMFYELNHLGFIKNIIK